jgi:multiple sugar transport system permease protein
MGRPSSPERPARVLATALRILVLALFLTPLVLAILGSLRPAGTPPPRTFSLVPAGASTSNYERLATTASFREQALNSLLVAAVAVPLGTLVASWAGFAIARLPRRSAVALIVVTVTVGTIPATTLFVGRLTLFRAMGITDSPVPLIAPALLGVTPLTVLLFAWAYHTLPHELYDLAREHGLGPIGTWWRVAMPLRAGTAAVAAALAFVVSWGNILDPLLYVYDERWFTLPVGIASLSELPPTDHGLMLAAGVVAIVPVLVFALLAQRVVLRKTW